MKYCDSLIDHRLHIKELAAEVLEMKKYPVGNLPPNADLGEILANITLAYRHLEDAAMRLGKAIQAYDGGVSCYDKKQSVFDGAGGHTDNMSRTIDDGIGERAVDEAARAVNSMTPPSSSGIQQEKPAMERQQRREEKLQLNCIVKALADLKQAFEDALPSVDKRGYAHVVCRRPVYDEYPIATNDLPSAQH